MINLRQGTKYDGLGLNESVLKSARAKYRP